MSAADVQKRIDDLIKRRSEMTPEQYQEEYEKLQQLLQENIYQETQVREPEMSPERRIAEIQREFRRGGAAGYVQNQAAKIYQEMQQEPELYKGQDMEDVALRRAIQRYKRMVLPKLAATTEYAPKIPSASFVSTIVDPKKGLVLDPATGEVRKASDLELLGQSLKRQAVYTPAELEPLGKGAEAKLKREQAQRQRAVGSRFLDMPGRRVRTKALEEAQQLEKEAKELQKEFEKDPKYRVVEEAGYVVESPLAYGFSLLNSGSAAMAPLVKGLQNLITPDVSTRADRYQKTEREGVLGQFLTNMVTRQGMYDQFQAQLLPPDADVDGVTAFFLQEGSPLTTALGFATEFVAPITPLGIPAEVAKIGKVATKPVSRVFSIRRMAQRKEIDDALRAVQSKKTAKQIQKDLKKEGKDVTPHTLRGRAAETIGDIVATESVLNTAKTASVGDVKKALQENPLSEAIFYGIDDTEKLSELSVRLNPFTDSLKAAKKTPALRRAFAIAEDIRDYVKTGKKPRFDASIIRRHVLSARIRSNPDVAESVSDLVKESYKRPLSSKELEELSDGLKKIKQKPVQPQGLDESIIYDATRGAVAEVLRDNFLKNIPGDMIAVGRSVVVPAKSIAQKAFRKNPKLVEYLKRRKEYMNHTSVTTDGVRTYQLTPEAQQNVRTLFEVQDTPLPFDISKPLNMADFNVLQNRIAEDLAIQLLDGIRLQQGSLTAEMARLKGAERGALISPVSGKKSASILQLKGLANSLRILQPKLFSFLKDIPVEMPPSMGRFYREMTDQSNRAFRQVEDRLKQTAGDEGARDLEIQRSMDQGLRVKMNQMEAQAPRAQEGIADVSPDEMAQVSDVVTPFETKRAQEFGELEETLAERYATRESKYQTDFDIMKARHDKVLREQKEKHLAQEKKLYEKHRDQLKKEEQEHRSKLDSLKRTLESRIRKMYRDKNEIKLQRTRQEYLSKKETINDRYSRKAKQARDEYTQGLLGTRFVQPGEKPLLAEVKAAESQQTKRLKQREALKKKYDSSLKKHQETRTNELKELEDTYDPILKEAYKKYQQKRLSLEEIVPMIQKEKEGRIRLNALFQKYKELEKKLKVQQHKRRVRLLLDHFDSQKKRTEKFELTQQNTQNRFQRRLDSLAEKQEQRISRFKERTTEKVEKKTEQQQERREKFASRRKEAALVERYGHNAVKAVLESSGIETYDQLLQNLDDLQNNMSAYVEAVYRGDQWRTLIKKFFTNPDKSFSKNSASPSFYIDQLKDGKNLDKAFLVNPSGTNLDASNILPVTPDNLALVIQRIREEAPALKEFGLSTNPAFKNSEDYFLPILELMVDIQRTENMQQAINRFVVEDPDLLVRVGQTYNSTAGLDAIRSVSSALENNILSTLQNAVDRNILKDVDVRLLIEQCKEVLFTSAMKDIWKSTGRQAQLEFIKTYLRDAVQNKRLISYVDEAVINAYNTKTLNSTTFDRIRQKSETILTSLVKQLQTAEKITAETQPIIDEFIRKVPEIIVGMEQDYLMTLLGKSLGRVGLFTDQVSELYSYMSRYGISPDATINNIKELLPTLEYIGPTNLALLHGGDMSGVYTNINDLFKTSTFEERLKKLAMFGSPANQYAAGKILSVADSTLQALSKFSISNMLYGIIQPSSRFMGFNRLTAPHIYLTTIGYGGTKVSDVIKFTGVALGGGIPLALRNVLQSLRGKTFGSFVDSNRYLYLPDDTVVIRAADTQAMRDYTAGELRQIGVDTGFEYSRAAAEFYDDQYKGLLEAMRMTPQGKMMGRGMSLLKKAWSNLSGQSNYLADFTHLQDAEIRRQVFIQSLKNGETVEDAVSFAKQVALDYTTLSKSEKIVLSRFIRFYAFMRTMGVATINNFARGIKGEAGGSIAYKLLRAQNTLTKETSQDFVSMTDDQRGRLFNMYVGTVDDVDLYLSGPPNPQIQAFELVSMFPLFALGAVTDNRIMTSDEIEMEYSVWSTIDKLISLSSGVAYQSAIESAEAQPVLEYALKRYAAASGGYVRPFPKEFIYAAEQQGILDDVIKRYDLVERYKTPGRPLAEGGKYYSFRKGTDGLKGYNTYLGDRLLGAYTLPAAYVGVYGVGGVRKDMIATSTRAISEYWKQRMLEEGVQSPEFRAKYLKSATIQKDIGMFQNILGAAYQLGIVTPTQSRSKKLLVDKAMKDAAKLQEKLREENGQ